MKRWNKTIPIVMSPAADAVAGGLIESLARPGGNVTGLTMITPDLTGKPLELLKEAVPTVARVAGVYPLSTRSTALPPWLKDTEAGANALGLRFEKLGLEEDARTWADAFKRAAKEPRIALVVIENARLISERTRIGELAGAPPPAGNVLCQRACRGRWSSLLRAGLGRRPSPCGYFRGQDPERQATGRLTGGAADEVRVHHKSEDGQSDRPDDST